jgi:UTP:GlnB (protein PII) uridylyltransferase
MLGVLPILLPELQALKGVDQSAPHIQDVWDHTLDTLKNLSFLVDLFFSKHDTDNALGLVLGLAVIRLGRYREQISAHLNQDIVPDRDLRALLFLAALYHDIAKPLTCTVESDGRIRFFDHDQAGGSMLAARAAALHLSNKEIERLALVVRHHMRPAHLAREVKSPSSRAIYRFFRDTQDAGIDICLLSLADILATYGNTLPQERWTRQLDVVRILMEAWWERPEQQVRPSIILTGKDLIQEFGLQPGPIIGEILESVREAQVMGQIESRREAIRFVKTLLDT